MKRLFKTAALAAATLAVAATGSFAGDYPDRPIGVAVSYGAGGATDFQARIVTMVAGNEDILGQPMYIINKPGAGGRVGWNWFATEADNRRLHPVGLQHPALHRAVDRGRCEILRRLI